MRRMSGWTAVACLIAASPAPAGDGGPLPPDQLPPEVTSRIREAFGAEPLHARKEVEGGRACYLVTAAGEGRVMEIYASPDGSVLARKTEAFSLASWVDRLAGVALVLLLPGVVAGAVARGGVRAARARPLPASGGWLAAWAGAVVGIGLVVFNLATVPRDKDLAVLGGYCAVWGAIAASCVEVAALAVQPGRRSGAPRRRATIGCVAVAAVALALSIPLDILSVERENNYFRRLTLRPLTD